MNAYQDAYVEKKKETLQIMEIGSYLNGMYDMQAIASVMSKEVKYPEKPYGLFYDSNHQEEIEEKELTEEEKLQAQKELLMKLQIMQSNFESSHRN